MGAEIKLAEEWLFEGEADNAKTADFKAKYDALLDMKEAIYLRIEEAEARPGAIAAARELLNNTKWALIDVTTTKPWINETVKAPAYEALARYEKWLNESIEKQDALKPSDPPAFYVKDLLSKFKTMVEYDLNVVMHKPKPRPPKELKVKNATNGTNDSNSTEEAEAKPASESAEKPEFSTESGTDESKASAKDTDEAGSKDSQEKSDEEKPAEEKSEL